MSCDGIRRLWAPDSSIASDPHGYQHSDGNCDIEPDAVSNPDGAAGIPLMVLTARPRLGPALNAKRALPFEAAALMTHDSGYEAN